MKKFLKRRLVIILFFVMIIGSIKNVNAATNDSSNSTSKTTNSSTSTSKAMVINNSNTDTDETIKADKSNTIEKNSSNTSTNDTTGNNSDILIVPSGYKEYRSGDYVIDSYDVNIDVDKYGIFTVTEKIRVCANKPIHGIIRKIPKKNEVIRVDNSKYFNNAKLKILSINDKYIESIGNDGNYNIKIGNPDSKFNGQKDYIIKYIYDIGKDDTDKFDELYFNIIGTEWDTYIGNVTFTINMPKEFDSSKLGFSSGRYGNYNSKNDIKYNVSKNQIKGLYIRNNGVLHPYEGITVRCELDEGYFEKRKFTTQDIIIIAVFLAIILISYLIWRIFGKDEKSTETVEFYPPDGLNSLDVGYYYNEKIKNRHIISLLFDLANKGYIKINYNKNAYKNNESGVVRLKQKNDSVDDIEIIQLKTVDGKPLNASVENVKNNSQENQLNEEEKEFLLGLLKNKYKDSKGNTKLSIKEDFYKTVEKIKKMESEKGKKVFSSNNLIAYFIFPVLTFIAVMMLGNIIKEDLHSFNLVEIDEVMVFFVILLCCGTGFVLFLMLTIIKILIKIIMSIKNIKWEVSAIIAIAGLIYIFIVEIYARFQAILFSYNTLFEFILGVLSIMLTIVFCALIPKRTKYGIQIYGRIKGFRNFLITAEKTKLEQLVEQNPQYFYNILPYTYTLGVSDKWAEKFKDIPIDPPIWMNDKINNLANSIFIYNMMDNIIEHESTIIVNPLDKKIDDMADEVKRINSLGRNLDGGGGSSGGGFSGGGFSGGGSGGGGGTSW